MKKIVMSGLGFSLTVLACSVFAAPISLACKPVAQHKVQACKFQAESDPSAQLYGFTNMAYALCSKALCTINTNNPKMATCACGVYNTTGWQSASISPKPYKAAHPVYKNKTLQTVYSNYSMANLTQFDNASGFNCQFNKPMPWANCFGAKCHVTKTVVNGLSTLSAVCGCPVKASTTFTTPGPSHQTECSTKPTQVWSAVQPMTTTYGGGSDSTALSKILS